VPAVKRQAFRHGVEDVSRRIPVMAKIPYVDKDACISCSLCVDMVPAVFRLGDDEIAEVFDPEGAPEEKIQEAIDSCPVSCIHWKE
jgi:ferredoxin